MYCTLVNTHDCSLWSIVLRCDQNLLINTQVVFLRAMVAPGTRTFEQDYSLIYSTKIKIKIFNKTYELGLSQIINSN